MPTVEVHTICFAVRKELVQDLYSLLAQFRQAKADRTAHEDVPRIVDIDHDARAELIEIETETAAQIVDILTQLP